jgi:uncharacterized protein (DUF924 family)
MPTEEFEDVLRFWFPQHLSADHAAMVRQLEWWFRGGTDSAVAERFALLLERAMQGGVDHWSHRPRSRLALIIVLDQFSRSIYRDTARAYAQDRKALALALQGIENGHYAALETPWEKTFFCLPLGHSEELTHLEVAVKLAEELVQQAPAEQQRMLQHSAAQARGHRTSLPATVAIRIATPSWGESQPNRNSTTLPAANSSTHVRCRLDFATSCYASVRRTASVS